MIPSLDGEKGFHSYNTEGKFLEKFHAKDLFDL